MTSAAAVILSNIQRDAFAWQLKNFGPTNELTMLAGLTEEHGEACEAMGDTELFLDAVGDSSVYLMQFCSLLKWDIADMWEGRDLYEMPSRPWPVLLGRISHHFVKGRVQMYRGTSGLHDDKCRIAIATLLRHWDGHLHDMRRDYVAVVEQTWRTVSARDWTKERPVPVATAGGDKVRALAAVIDSLGAVDDAKKDGS